MQNVIGSRKLEIELMRVNAVRAVLQENLRTFPVQIGCCRADADKNSTVDDVRRQLVAIVRCDPTCGNQLFTWPRSEKLQRRPESAAGRQQLLLAYIDPDRCDRKEGTICG